MGQDNGNIGLEVYDKVRLIHTDSVICGIAAIATKTNAPTVLRNEAINNYEVNPSKLGLIPMAKCFGSKLWVHSEKAIAANVSAVRAFDANATIYGYDPSRKGHNAGEFGHTDYYPVVIAACQNNNKWAGKDALKGMILLDEIRGRLCEVYALRPHKIDHVVHGAIASALTYGAIMGANVD